MGKFRIALLLKKEKKHNVKVINFLKKMKNVKLFILEGDSKSNYPEILNKEKFDFIISYLSPWVIKKKTLLRTNFKNINFHPSLPKYPGFGCYNLCLYNQDKYYGVTCHEMEKKVDTGKIYYVKKFRVKKNLNLDELINITYREMFNFFKKKIKFLLENKKIIPVNNINWDKKNFSKKKDVDKLSLIKLNMSNKEASRRIRSTYLKKKFYPKISIFDKIYELKEL